jgi:hypothetical protein
LPSREVELWPECSDADRRLSGGEQERVVGLLAAGTLSVLLAPSQVPE